MRRKGLLVMCLVFGILSPLLYLTYLDRLWRSPSHLVHSDDTYLAFAVDTPGCRIPSLDPYDPSIKKYISTEGAIRCRARPLLTYADDNWLRINQHIWNLYYKKRVHGCYYQAFIRGKDDNSIKYRSAVKFINDTRIDHEFIRVTCFSNSSARVYRYFHAFPVEKLEVEKRCEAAQRNKDLDDLNVIAFGTDSMSRSNFVRQFQKTRTFLLNELDAIELLGYNKIGDNTLPNLAAMTSGKYLSETLDRNKGKRRPADFLPFILKNYSHVGYRTFLGEDDPDIATFNYLRKGFIDQPTDYYFRPYSLGLGRQKDMWRNYFCAGPFTETELVLDYVARLLKKLRNKRHFLFFFFSRITHYYLNKGSSVDEIYYQFFRKAKQEGFLNNTVVLFFGDHGMRFGAIRATYIGSLEERLPGFYISFPRWFEHKYPERVRNVRRNAHRLTTPFDVHETLLNLINLTAQGNSVPGLKRGLSLFEEIPQNRTCRDATIAEQWCTCHRDKPIDVNDKHLQVAAQFVVAKINHFLSSHRNVCATLDLQEVTSAYTRTINDAINVKTAAKVMYQLTVKTRPGDGLFEATVSRLLPKGTFTLLGDISRTNRYKDQSFCVQEPRQRLYCYCKSLGYSH